MRNIIFCLLLFASQISISQNSFSAEFDIPNEIIQGEYADVVLTISKPKDALNFTVFKQKLPVGFFIKMIDSYGASYTFENNILKLTWLRSPKEGKFSVKYQISSMVGVTGNFKISGNLNYMVGAKQAIFKLTPKIIRIYRNTSSLNDKRKNNFDIYNSKLKGAYCKRKVTFNELDNFYIVELILKTEKAGSYSLSERIPKSFEFSEDDLKGAVLNKKSDIIQYVFYNLPSNETIKISYRLSSKTKTLTNPEIKGKLSFLKKGIILNTTILQE